MLANPGDMARVNNNAHLSRVYATSLAYRKVQLVRLVRADEIAYRCLGLKQDEEAWWVRTQDTYAREYYLPACCLESCLEPTIKTFNKGDLAIGINLDRLKQISASIVFGKEVILKKSDDHWHNYLTLDEHGWWVAIKGDESRGDYWVPSGCLSKQTTNSDMTLYKHIERQTDNMTLYNITIAVEPSIVAQQGGAKEEIVAEGKELASTYCGAVAMVAAKNAEAILAKADKGTLKVYQVSGGSQC